MVGGMKGQVKPGFGQVIADLYSGQRLNSSAPLVPPKPKEFDMAYSSLALRA
jgi:hypothetical protein